MFKTDPIAPLSFTGNKITLVKQTSSEDEIINAILSLSTFDVTKISPEIIEIISRDWSYFTSKTLEVYSTTCPTITPKSLIAFIYLGRMVAILENRRKNQKQVNSPISIFQRKSIFNWNNNSSTNFILDYIQIPDLTDKIRLVNYLFNLFNMNHFNIYDVILWSLQLTILSENMINTFPSIEEIKKMPNHIPIMGEKVILPQNTLGFAIIRYLYNKIFCTHIKFPYKLQEIKLDFSFDLKIDDHLCWKKSIPSNIKISSYLYANSFPNLDFMSLSKDISKIPIGIFTLILLNSEFNFSEITQSDVDNVMDIIKSSDLPYQSLLLLLHYSSENELFKIPLETIISDDSLSENWSNAKSLLSKSKNRAVERYISKAKNGNIKAAKKLCYFPECYEEIKEVTTFPLNCVKMFFDANNIHQNLEVESEPTLENAILLYKLFQNNLFISNDSYLPLIKNCHSIILKAVHDGFSLPDAEWIMSGCSTFLGIFYLPKYQADLIFEQKGNKAYISFLNAFFASKCLEKKKIPEIPEVADFFTCSFLNNNFLTDFPFSRDLIRKTKLSHIEAAFKADEKIFIDRVCNSVERTNNSLSVIVEVLAKHDAYNMFLKIISNDISFLQYFAISSNNFKCDFILRYLTENNLQEKSPDDLLQIMNQILIIDDDKTDAIVYKVVASILEKNPEQALKIIKFIPLKKTFVETILSNIQNIPSPIPIEYLAFIKEVADMLDKVQCQSSFTPMKALTNEWNEDFENGNSNKRKSKRTIWDFPDDIGECTQIETGKDYQTQPWFHCNTCGLIGNNGCCLPCALRCHRHHDFTFAKISGFYCDCYEKIELCKFLQDKYKSSNEIEKNENDEEDEEELNIDQLPEMKYVKNNQLKTLKKARKSTTAMSSEIEEAERRSLRRQIIEQQIMQRNQQQQDIPITTNPNATSAYSYYASTNRALNTNSNSNKLSFTPRYVDYMDDENEYAFDDMSEGYLDDQMLDDANIDRNNGFQQAPVSSYSNSYNRYYSAYPKYSFNFNKLSFKSRYQPQLSSNSQSIFFREQPNYSLSNNPAFSFITPNQQQQQQQQQQGKSFSFANSSIKPSKYSSGTGTYSYSSTKSTALSRDQPSPKCSFQFSESNASTGSSGTSTGTGFGPKPNNTGSAFGNSTGTGFTSRPNNNTGSTFSNSSGTGFTSRPNNNAGSAFGNSSGTGFTSRPNNNAGSTFSNSSGTGFTSRPNNNAGSAFGNSTRTVFVQNQNNNTGSTFGSRSDGNAGTAFVNASGARFGSRPDGNTGTSAFGTTLGAGSTFGSRPDDISGPTLGTTTVSAFGSRPDGNTSSFGASSRPSPYGSSYSTFSYSSKPGGNTGSSPYTYGSKSDANSNQNSGGSWGNAASSKTEISYGTKSSLGYGYSYSKNKYANAAALQSSPSQIRMTQDPIDVLTGIMIISKMLNVKVTPPPPLKNNLTTYDDVKSIKLNGFPNCEVEQFAHFENSGLRCIDSTSFFLTMSNSLSQMNICAAIGSNYDKVIVCEGQNAKVYDIKTNLMLCSCEIKIAPLRITVSELDGTIFAVSSMFQVYVYSLNESTGQIELNHKIELMLEELGRSLSVVSVDWVPLEPLHLAITCTNFVKIYDIPADCISPIACFTSKDRISSSFLTVYDDEPYVFVASNNGKIYYNKCNVDGPCVFTNTFMLNLANFFNPKSITISYCKDSDLLFISSTGPNFLILHLDEMMNQQNKANGKPTNQPQKQNTFSSSGWATASTSSTSSTSIPFCNVNISGSSSSNRHNCLEFVGVHPDVPSIFILRDRINGDVILVEFSSKGVSNFAVNLPILPNQFINSNVSILGTFISCGNMYAIGSDCYLYKLVPGKHQSSAVMKLRPPPEIPKVSTDDEENDEGNNRKGKKSKRTNDKKKPIGGSISIDDQNQSLTSSTAAATPVPSNSLASAPSQSASSFSIQASQNNSSLFQLTNANNQSSEFTETNPTFNEELSNISNSAFSFSINSSDNLTGQMESILNATDEDESLEEDDDDIEDENDDEGNTSNVDYHYILSNRGFRQNYHIPNMNKDISKLQEEKALRASKLKKGEIDGFSFEVPATFWTESRIETTMMTINDHNHNDCTQLIFGRRQSFHDRIITLNIASLDSKNMIVGFKLCFSSDKRSMRSKPESIKIFNRRYVSTQSHPRDFCLPLKKSEVGINKSYKIEMVSHSIEIDLDKIDIFVIDAATAENQDKKDWINDASFITDFIDISEIKCENDVDYIIQSISAANFLPLQSYSLLSKKDENKENIDDIISKEDIELKKLFIWMYTNSKISLASRRILIKSLGADVNRFEKLCTVAIIEICGNKGPDEKLKNLMWRDYAFLPQSQKNKIGDIIWKFYDNHCGALGFSSAFLFEK